MSDAAVQMQRKGRDRPFQSKCESSLAFNYAKVLAHFLSVKHLSSAVAEENLDLSSVENRGYFTVAELIVHHRLALFIGTIAIIRSSDLAFAHVHRGFYTAGKCACGLTGQACCLSDGAELSNRTNDVFCNRVARRTHAVDLLIDCESFFFTFSNCHIIYVSSV